MKHTWSIGTLFLLLLLMNGGCSGVGQRQPTPTPPAPIETLLLEPDLFPGWHVGEKDTSDDSCSVLGCGNELERILFSLALWSPHSEQNRDTGTKIDIVSTHRIWRYRSTKQAYKGYRMYLDDYGPELDTSPTQNISYTSTIAQHMTISCKKTADIFCSTTAQYGLYVVRFTSHIDQDNMSYDDYERMLAEIDKKMAPVANVR